MIQAALPYYGLKEVDGPGSNPKILEMINRWGDPSVVDDSKYAWCAIFLMQVAWDLGITIDVTPAARSFLNVGKIIAYRLQESNGTYLSGPDALYFTEAPQPGDIMVSWRESITSWKGHATLFVNWTDESEMYYRGFGGNQKNQVGVNIYATSTVLGTRRLAT